MKNNQSIFIKKIIFFVNKYQNLFLFGLLLIVGLSLRAMSFRQMPFSFDQVQIARESEKIAHGDITLVGPRTGPANMFTGPLIYYIAGFFAIFTPSWWAVFWTMLSITLMTGVALYLLAKKYLDQDFANIVLVLWAFSPFLIKIDQIPWNPNLAILASSLVFFPLLKKEKILSMVDLLLVSAGVFLGYQAHFSGLLLVGLAGLLILLFFKNKISASVVIILSFFASLIPTFIFDLRNNWMNSRGLMDLVLNKDKVASYQILDRLLNKIFIVIESLGKLIFEGNSPSLIWGAGLFIQILFFLLMKKDNKKIIIYKILLWLLIVPVAFSFYRESTPEYYFLILIPVFLFMISYLLEKIKNKLVLSSLVLLLFFSSFQTNFLLVSANSGFQLGAQLKAKDYIKNQAEIGSVSRLVFDLKEMDAIGIKYLLEQEKIDFNQNGDPLHLIYPINNSSFISYQLSNNAAMWMDIRNNSDRDYLTTDQYIISYPKEWMILENKSSDKKSLSDIEYLILDENGKKTGIMSFFSRDTNKSFVEQTEQQLNHILEIREHNNKRSVWVIDEASPDQMILVRNNWLVISDLMEPEKIDILFN